MITNEKKKIRTKIKIQLEVHRAISRIKYLLRKSKSKVHSSPIEAMRSAYALLYSS